MSEKVGFYESLLLKVINDFKHNLSEVLPDLIAALLILLVGIFIAYFLKWSSKLFVKWMLLLLPKSITEKSFVKDNLKGLVLGTGRILFFVTIFFTLATSFKKLGFVVISEWMQNLSKYLPNIFGALLILYVGWKAKELISNYVHKALSKTDFAYAGLTSKLLAWSVFIISLLVSLEQVGVDMSLVITISTVLIGVVAGGIVLTFALGAKQTISDILYCYQLNRYLKVGKEIEISGYKGKIKAIGPTFVLIQTLDGEVAIPGNIFNREVAKLSVGNGGHI